MLNNNYNKSLDPKGIIDTIFTDDLCYTQRDGKYSFSFNYLGDGVFLIKSKGYIDEKSFRIQLQIGDIARERLKELHSHAHYHLIWDISNITGISLTTRSLMVSKIATIGLIHSISTFGKNPVAINFNKILSKMVPWVRFFYFLKLEDVIENLDHKFNTTLKSKFFSGIATPGIFTSLSYFLEKWYAHPEYLHTAKHNLRILRNAAWQYDDPDGSYSAQVNLVEGNILYFECSGFAKTCHIDRTYDILENIIEEVNFFETFNKYYSVLDISKLNGISLSARKQVASYQKKYYNKVHMILMIPSPVMSMLLRIIHILNIDNFAHWELMNSVEDAFNRIIDHRDGQSVKNKGLLIENPDQLKRNIPDHPSQMRKLILKQQQEIEQLKKYQSENINNILEIMGRMTWDESFSEESIIDKSPGPFSDIYTSLHVLFQDFQEIIGEKTFHAQQLKESEDKYKNIVNLANDIIAVYQDGIIKFVNSRIEQILGYEPEQVMGKGLETFIVPEEQGRLEMYYQKRMHGVEVPWFYETSFIHQSGIHIPFSMSVGIIEFENRPASMVIARDMSMKKRNEEELERYRNHLEDIVKERTEQLQKEISERKIAEESDRLKTAFLSNMSHEIRTPMNAIISFSRFLKNPDLQKEDHDEYLNYIQSSGESLLTLINDIIDLSKIEAHQLQIHESLCSIDPILDELYIYFDRHLKHLGKEEVNLKLHIPDRAENIQLLTDGYRLRQIVTNLLDNAIKFTDTGNIEFGYKMLNEMIVFYVQDTGVGIPSDKLHHIFKRFGKVEFAGRNLSGTGLGLAISLNLATLLHGTLRVESVEGQGSTFYLEIPFRKSGHHQITEILMEASYRDHYNWNNKNIMIVEDEDLNFRVLQISLRNTKAKIIRAVNGKEAVEKMKELNDIDLILMDIQMPIMDGYEALSNIKRTHPNVPIIAQTAYAMMEEKKRCLEMGFDDYISKPIKFEELFAKVDRLIEKKVF